MVTRVGEPGAISARPASLADLKARMDYESDQAALIYQHATLIRRSPMH